MDGVFGGKKIERGVHFRVCHSLVVGAHNLDIGDHDMSALEQGLEYGSPASHMGTLSTELSWGRIFLVLFCH